MHLKISKIQLLPILVEALIFAPLIALPLLYLPSVTFEWTYLKAFAFEAAVAIAAVYLIITSSKSYKSIFAEGTGFLPALSLFFWAVFTAAMSKHPWAGVQPLIEYAYIIAGIFALGLIFSSEKRRNHFLAAYGAICAVTFIIYIMAYSTSPDRMKVFPFGNPNLAAAFALVPLLAGAAAGFSFLKDGKYIWGALGLVVAVVSGGAILRSASAAGALAAGAGFIILIIMTLRGRLRIALTAVAGFLIVLALILLIFAPRARSFTAMQFGVRPIIWSATIELIKEKPLLGHGAGTYFIEFSRHYPYAYAIHPYRSNIVETAHSLPLNLLSDLGLVGLALAIWLLYEFAVIARNAYRRTDERWRPLVAGIIAGSIAMLLQALVSTELHYIEASVQLVLALAMLSAFARGTFFGEEERAVNHLWLRTLIAVAACAVFVATSVPGVISQVYLGKANDRDLPVRESIYYLEKAAKSGWTTHSSLEAMGYLAYQYQQVNRDDDALAVLTKIDGLAPNLGTFRLSMAAIYIRKGNIRLATDAIVSYAEKDPFNQQTYPVWKDIVAEAESQGIRSQAKPHVAVKLLEEVAKYDSERFPASKAREIKKNFLPRP